MSRFYVVLLLIVIPEKSSYVDLDMDRLGMKIIAAYADNQFSKPIEYTFNLIFSILGVEYEVLPYSELASGKIGNRDLLVSYGHEKVEQNVDYQIHIYQSKLFGREYKTLSSMPRLPLKRWNGLPVIYEGNGRMEDIVVRSGNMIQTNIDIIASSFFMLSRYEEIILEVKDEHDRFPAQASIAYKENFLTRPIVNEYIDLFWKWIDSFNLGLKRKTLWGSKDFAVFLTHDVDKIKKYRWWCPPLNSFVRTMRRRQFGKTLHYAWDWIASLLKTKPDPYWTFEQITELEHGYGFTSSFYFLAGGNTKYDRHRYSINNSKVIDLMKRLDNMGYEIGLHGSYNSFNDCGMLAGEKDKLDAIMSNKQCGGRQHYLRWKTPDTWRVLEKSGMVYDTTLAYSDHVGFRCGICLPFKPFDVLEDRAMDLWEIPLTMMEGSLFSQQDLSLEEIFETIRSLIDTIQRHRGVFVTLWHNNCFYELENPGAFEVYKQMLDYLSSKDVLCITARERLSSWLKAV